MTGIRILNRSSAFISIPTHLISNPTYLILFQRTWFLIQRTWYYSNVLDIYSNVLDFIPTYLISNTLRELQVKLMNSIHIFMISIPTDFDTYSNLLDLNSNLLDSNSNHLNFNSTLINRIYQIGSYLNSSNFNLFSPKISISNRLNSWCFKIK